MLEDQITYITGATRGIGATIARTFAANGASLIVNGRNPESTAAFCEELRDDYGVQVLSVVADQRDSRAIKDSYQRVFKEFKRLDVLVNNAGILDDALLGMISEESIVSTFEVNALAVVRNMQGAARLMQRGGAGSIINIASIIGTTGNAGQVVYGGSKAAVIGMTKSAAKELAPSNIRVNAIAPGFIDTEMTQSLPKEKYDERMASIGMNRIGTPEDVANVALFLASGMSGYVTGQTIGVDGAMVI